MKSLKMKWLLWVFWALAGLFELSISTVSGQTHPSTHLVQPQQTWYGIARLHNVGVNELQSLNPQILAAGLQPGDTLRLPQPATLPDIPVLVSFDEPHPVDTLPRTLPVLTSADTLKLLAILPFQFDADTLMGGIEDPRVVRLRQISLEFYYGMRWAAEELTSAGMDVSLRVVDSAPDSLGDTWSLPDLLWADAVFGPLRTQTLDSALDVSALLGKPHWALASSADKILSKGDHVFVAEPDPLAAARLLGTTAARCYAGEQVTMLATGLHDADLEEAFAAAFTAARDSSDSPLVRHLVSPRFAEGVSAMLDTSRTHVFAVPSGKSSRAMVAHLQNELLKADSIETRLLMHPDARDYEFLEHRLLHHTRLITPTADFADWADTTTLYRFWPYRDLTGTDPSQYAMLAHDAVLESASWCNDFPIGAPLPAPISHHFIWRAESSGRAWRNQSWQIEQFSDGWWIPLPCSPSSGDKPSAAPAPSFNFSRDILNSPYGW